MFNLGCVVGVLNVFGDGVYVVMNGFVFLVGNV